MYWRTLSLTTIAGGLFLVTGIQIASAKGNATNEPTTGLKTNCRYDSNSSRVHNILTGTDGDDEILGTNCNDEIIGGEGNDYLYGGWNQDRLFGGPGNDYLDGGGAGGVDYLDGGEGSDTYRANGGAGSTFYDSGTGADDWDVIEGSWPTFLRLTAENGIEEILSTSLNGCGEDYIDLRTVKVPDGFSINTATAESHCSSGKLKQGPDVVYGSASNDIIRTGPGDDFVDAYLGDDVIYLTPGADRIVLGEGNDHITTGVRSVEVLNTTIEDFNPAEDKISLLELYAGTWNERVAITLLDLSQDGPDVVISAVLEDGSLKSILRLEGVTLEYMKSTNFVTDTAVNLLLE
jgi:Ca2+-binding RTX toxin-like protein